MDLPVLSFYYKRFYHKGRDNCIYTDEYRGAEHNIRSLKCSLLKENPLVFENRSTYGYHFMIKKVAEELERQFNSLVENTEHSLFSFNRERCCLTY